MSDLKALLDIGVVNNFGKAFSNFSVLYHFSAMVFGLLLTGQPIVIQRFDL